MNIIYSGYFTSQEESIKHKGTSLSGNLFEKGFVSTIYNYFHDDLSVVTVTATASYPTEKTLFFRGRTNIVNDITTYEIPFLNVPLIKQWMQAMGLKRFLKRHLKKDTVIVQWNINAWNRIALKYAQKRGCRIVAIITDPILNTTKTSGIKTLMWKTFEKKSNDFIKQCDKLIVVNENIIKDYAPNCPFLLFETAVEVEMYREIVEMMPYEDEEKTSYKVFFAGALLPYNGIELIISLSKKNLVYNGKPIVFEVYGEGEMREKVEEEAGKNPTLIYKGYRPHSEVLEAIMKSDILLNLRDKSMAISDYTFPGKISEYIICGKAIISTELNGFNDFFLNSVDILKTFDEDSVESLIYDILSRGIDALNNAGLKKREYILNNYSWDTMGKKIINFIKG